ncbi:MAG: cytochrome c biogenesis protein CcsA [Bacteroidota bacterium]|nr:cytochrome c biogenesis protein CcsA [Bacteroidota bacterium]
MKKYINTLFGMPFMALLLIIFAIAIGYATFIESSFGTTASKAVIYNAKWFEAILLFLSVTLIVNIFRNKLYKLKKLPVFLFHLSFLIIIVGAAFTRYNSIDGMMQIREGESSEYFSSSQLFFKAKISKNDKVEYFDSKTLMSLVSPGYINKGFKFDNQKFEFKSRNFIPSATGRLMPFETGRPAAHILISVADSRQEFFLTEGDVFKFGEMIISFGDFKGSDFSLMVENNKIFIKSTLPGNVQSMEQGNDSLLIPNYYYPFNKRVLYSFDAAMIVLVDFSPKAEIMYFTDQNSNTLKPDVIEMKYEFRGLEKSFYLQGGKGFLSIPYIISDNGYKIELSYSTKYYSLPFSVYLNDFIIKRYPGSGSPSSFQSEVTVLGKNDEKIMDYSIYMNHIMNFKGYRFFQSSYDTDEKGTILSVNYDVLGMRTTYMGYFMLFAGMLLALFWKGSRFRKLLRRLNTFQQKASLFFILVTGISFSSFAQDNSNIVPNKQQSEKFGTILIQEKEGRIKPLNTYTLDLLRKIYGKASYKDYSASQVILGIMMNPGYWHNEKVIKVANRNLNTRLGLKGKYASFLDFFDTTGRGTYKLQALLDASHKKFPTERSKFDRDVITVDERVNVYSMLRHQVLLTIFPNPNNINAPWLSSYSKPDSLPEMDSLFIKTALSMYLDFVRKKDSKNADFIIDGVKNYQQNYAASILPSKTQMTFETLYELYNIFPKLAIIYLILGIIAIFLVFAFISSGKQKAGIGIRVLKTSLIIALLIHATGIGIRWYISGHAPFSNGYEAMIFISWSGLFAGLLLSRKSILLLPVITLFAAAPLLVAYLTMMNPDITNLVPVLKSYWLSIHVATITASYGVLGSVFFGAFLNLILMLFKTQKNRQKIDRMIGELTTLNQLSTILGLFLLTIGCFLGAIWANESWGTYWSWDPKETWCLVSILVYSYTAHIQFIPGLKTNFAFNFSAFWSYSTILMTYFGVNYFLGGMHSYAKGDAMGIHYGYIVTIILLFIISITAGIKESKFENQTLLISE